MNILRKILKIGQQGSETPPSGSCSQHRSGAARGRKPAKKERRESREKKERRGKRTKQKSGKSKASKKKETKEK